MKLLPNCKEVSRLVSEGLDRDLGLVERTRLRLHLMACEGCTNFTRHMGALRSAMHRLSDGDSAD